SGFLLSERRVDGGDLRAEGQVAGGETLQPGESLPRRVTPAGAGVEVALRRAEVGILGRELASACEGGPCLVEAVLLDACAADEVLGRFKGRIHLQGGLQLL